MQYSDEIIKQELIRYAVTNSPDVSDDEVARWKESFVNVDNDTIQLALFHIKGRSWFWARLMQAIEMPTDSKSDDVSASMRNMPEFVIGIQVAMRMLGKPIEEAKAEPETIIEPFESEPEPKRKVKKNAGKK